MMYPSNIEKFSTFGLCSNQWVHQKLSNKHKTYKMATNGGQTILTIDDVTDFLCKYRKCFKTF